MPAKRVMIRQRKRSPRQKLVLYEWLDPDTALDFAYATHSADDESIMGTSEGELAKREALLFRSLTAPPETPDWSYLAQVSLIVFSHARGITRRKKAQLRDLAAAQAQYDEAHERLKGSQTEGAISNLLRSIGFVPALLGAMGYFFAQTIGPFLLPYMPESTPHSGVWPSLLAMFMFGGVGKILSARWTAFSLNRISSTYRQRCQMARLIYERGKYEEIKNNRMKLSHLWKGYTGQTYPETASYALVIAGDLKTEEMLQQAQTQYQMSDVAVVFGYVRLPFQRYFKRRKSVGQQEAISSLPT